MSLAHAESGIYLLNSFYLGDLGFHVNPGAKFRSTRAVYSGPLKDQTEEKSKDVVLYSERGLISGGTFGLSLGSPYSMKLLVMVGQYLDAKGRIAESQATVGFADLVTGARSNRTSKKSGGSSGKRLTGGLLVKAGFGGGEASLSIPDSESTTTGVAVQTYKVNPLKHGGPSLAEESVKTDAGNGFAFFKEWFPWDSHGSCYFRIGGGYLRYPEGDSYTGVDLGFGQRWVVGNLAFDISWLQLMIHTNQIEKPSEDSGVKNRHPGVRTPAFGLGYAF